MAKIRLTGATFDASEKTVTHTSFSDVTLAGIQLIVNVTDQIIIYNFADTAKGGTLATDTLTLEYDTTSMSDTDELMILVEDGTTTQPVSAASLPLPSGAATSAKQDTIIGHLDGVETVLGTIDTDTGNISTKIDTIAGAVSGTEMQVDVLTMPSVAVTNGGLTELAAAINASSQMDVNIAANGIGLATSAKQDTIIGHVDGIEGLLTTIDSDTSELAAALNASNQMDVNIAASGATVPVSNAGLTELAAAINSNKVDVNIVSSDVATGGTSAADDADFTATTTPGTPSMGVYESTPTTVTDGDLGVVGITSGRRLKTSATIDAALPAGTNAIGKLAANSGVDIGDVDILSIAAGDNNIGNVDIASAIPAGTNNIGDVDVLTVPADPFGANADAAATAGSTGSIQAKLRLMTSQLDSIKTAVETIDNTVAGSELQVDVLTMPTVTVTATNLDVQSGGADLATTTQAGAIQTAVELIDDTVKVLGTDTYTEATSKGVVMGAVRRDADTTLANTTNEFTPLQVDANGYLKVEIFDGGGSHTVDNNGTFATQVDGAALTALQLIDDTVFADDAGFTLSTHKGNVIAGVAVETDGTDPTAVVEADAAALRTDRNRLLIVNQTHPRFWHVSADYASAQTNASVKAAPGASLSLYITDIVLSNGATAGNITLLDGSGGTVLFEIYPAINGGATISLRSPIKLTANTALCITSTTVTTHSIFVSGYIAP